MKPSQRYLRRLFSIGLVIVAATGFAAKPDGPQRTPPAAGAPAPNDLVVHEWGTFLGMNGSDGTALDGMYHEEHALPGFVHSRSRDQLRLPFMFLKGETPVIYFYTNVRQPVRVGVGFPRGIWTQWYPQASLVRPSLLETAEKPGVLEGGRICWFTEVIPATTVDQKIGEKRGAAPESEVKVPASSADALWNHAREVDAAYVKVVNGATQPPTPEYERFLFYRGLGETRLPLRFDEGAKGSLTLDRDESLGEGVRDIFVLRIENGRGAFSYLPAMRPGQKAGGLIPSMAKSQPLAEFTRIIADLLAARLTAAGLYPKEARAMVNTWTTSYFQTEGVRALVVMPQSWTDAFIPISIEPQPKQVVRVMVGRLELLSAERERLAEDAVRDLGAPDPAKREQAFRFLHEQGRYAEPIIRRVVKVTKDENVRTLCRRLLLADFVTELRATIHNAADGKRLNTDPVLLRAQLARLLREVGLNAEARSEGEAVLAALKVHATDQNQPQAASPLALEIRAAALEATGDDETAARIYARRIELLVRSIPGQIPSATVAWIKEWSVSRAYVQCVERSKKLGTTITTLNRGLDRMAQSPIDDADARAARVFVALLVDRQGDHALADSHWSLLMGAPKMEAAQAPLVLAPEAAGESGR
jgi:hypothetical protein